MVVRLKRNFIEEHTLAPNPHISQGVKLQPLCSCLATRAKCSFSGAGASHYCGYSAGNASLVCVYFSSLADLRYFRWVNLDLDPVIHLHPRTSNSYVGLV